MAILKDSRRMHSGQPTSGRKTSKPNTTMFASRVRGAQKKEPHRCKTVRFTRFVSHYGRCPKAAASAALGQPTYATLHRFTSSLGKTSRVTRDPPVANTDTPGVAGLGPLPSATADEPDKALARDVAHLVTVFPAPLLGGLCRGTRTADAQDHASVDYTHCIGRNASKRLRKWQMTG